MIVPIVIVPIVLTVIVPIVIRIVLGEKNQKNLYLDNGLVVIGQNIPNIYGNFIISIYFLLFSFFR